ncbi:hypothetical protein C8E97_1650 [Saccharothrix australiensis]|uniref:Uncharacterized protein n=1 Tax=Saccharothrix australiensis TaxID=2072 RepID=A0A495VUS2_9PSEU|nr:hypothetical protein C8E97_1650 [Saccharothrix australiensis]
MRLEKVVRHRRLTVVLFAAAFISLVARIVLVMSGLDGGLLGATLIAIAPLLFFAALCRILTNRPRHRR